MSRASPAPDVVLSFARLIRGSSTTNVVDSTVVVAPFTVKFPVMVTLSGRPTVIVPLLSATVTSLEVPLKVIALPGVILVEFDPSVTETAGPESFEFAIEPAS